MLGLDLGPEFSVLGLDFSVGWTEDLDLIPELLRHLLSVL